MTNPRRETDIHEKHSPMIWDSQSWVITVIRYHLTSALSMTNSWLAKLSHRRKVWYEDEVNVTYTRASQPVGKTVASRRQSLASFEDNPMRCGAVIQEKESLIVKRLTMVRCFIKENLTKGNFGPLHRLIQPNSHHWKANVSLHNYSTLIPFNRCGQVS